MNIELAKTNIILKILSDQEDIPEPAEGENPIPLLETHYDGVYHGHGPIFDELSRLEIADFELYKEKVQSVLRRAQESLNMVLALILYCRWKLLRSNQPQEESLKWLQGYLEVPNI